MRTLCFCSLLFGMKLQVPVKSWSPRLSKCFLSSDGPRLEDLSCLTSTTSWPPTLSPTTTWVPYFSMNLSANKPNSVDERMLGENIILHLIGFDILNFLNSHPMEFQQLNVNVLSCIFTKLHAENFKGRKLPSRTNN